MTDPTPRLREGVLGRFWLVDRPPTGRLRDEDAVHGSIRLLDDGVLVRTILSDVTDIFVEPDGGPSRPRWLFGITQGGGTLIVPTLAREAHQLSLFGSYTSLRTFRGPAVITYIDAAGFGPRVTRLLMKLPRPEWADLRPLTQTGHFDDKRRWQGLDIQLRSTESINCGRAGSINVELSGGWNQAYGETDQHHSQIWTSLDVTTHATRPRPVEEHVDVARRVQDLLSICHDRQLAAYSCRVRVEGAGDDSELSWLWHHDLNAAADTAAGQDERPYIQLKDLGTPRAVTRWVELTRRFPDTAEAICPRTRLAQQMPRLLQLGVAIEKYVGLNTKSGRARGKSPAWTKRVGKTDPYAARLARHAGRAFSAFIGDPDKWGSDFADTYNSAKHPYAAAGVVPERTLFFNLSAQLLLTCILLDRAAGTRTPSTTMLADHRLQAMSDYARNL